MKRFLTFSAAFLLFVSMTALTASASTLAEIRERGTLRVAMEDEDYGLFHFREGDKNLGLDYDLAQAIAEAIGVSLEVVPLPWGDGEAGTISGAWSGGGWPVFGVDLMCTAATITDERAEKVTFSAPYFSAGQLLLTLKAKNLTALDQVKGLKLGFQQATTSETTAKELLAGNTFLPLPGVPDVMNALRKGLIDAALLDSPLALTEAKNDGTLAVVDELLTEEHFGVTLPREADPELKALVDDVVATRRQALYDKWFK